jgi:endonuclease/exonuclease/phosphatase family metal-dependent hydrolase
MRPGTEPATRIQHIINKFIELDPNIIGLQEINEDKSGDNSDNQVIVIGNALSDHFNIPYYYYFEKTHDAWDNQFKEYVGIISKYAFEEQGYFDLQPGVFPRKVVWGLFNTPIGNINFFNTHLSYHSAWVNEKEIDEMLNYAFSKMAPQNNYNGIIIGDFNATPDTPSYLKMINANYSDTYKTIHPNSNGFTAPYPGQSIRIDYIFVHNNSILHTDDSYLFGDKPISQDFYYSDHLGILTTFSNPTYVEIMEELAVPKSFSLSQNYPNPFNPSTKINFTLTETGFISLKVFNVLGNELATLVDEELQQGNHEFDFNAINLTNGVYFYRLSQNNNSVIKKMLLVK